MNARELYRFAAALGLLGLVSPLFGLSSSARTNFVLVQGAGAVVLVLIGGVALAGALLRRGPVLVIAGAAALVAAVLQLIQFGRSTNWLEGNGSTFSLLLGLGVGLLVCGLTRTEDTTLAAVASARLGGTRTDSR